MSLCALWLGLKTGRLHNRLDFLVGPKMEKVKMIEVPFKDLNSGLMCDEPKREKKFEENKVFITGYSNATAEGVTLHFSGKTSIQSGGLKSDSWFVSWDKIGKALCGSEYRRDD